MTSIDRGNRVSTKPWELQSRGFSRENNAVPTKPTSLRGRSPVTIVRIEGSKLTESTLFDAGLGGIFSISPSSRRVLGRNLGVAFAGLDARQRFRIGCGSNNLPEDNSHGQAVLRIQGQDVEQVLGN